MTKAEIEFSGEVSTPVWMPITAKIGVKVKKVREARGETYLADVIASSRHTLAEVEEFCLADEDRADLLMNAGSRASEVADQDYRSALGRLVGAAFHDDAKILEVSLLTSQLVQLEPAHLRLLRTMFHQTGSLSPKWPERGPALAAGLGVETAAVTGLLERLAAFGLVMSYKNLPQEPVSHPEDKEDQPKPRRRTFHTDDRYWEGTPWGQQALRLCGDQVT